MCACSRLPGPGGVGKTRLAVAVASHLQSDPHFANEIAFVQLASISDPDLVAPTIAQAFGLADASDPSALPLLGDALARRAALLVLDNFEQVLPAAGVLAQLLSTCATLKLLVTSQRGGPRPSAPRYRPRRSVELVPRFTWRIAGIGRCQSAHRARLRRRQTRIAGTESNPHGIRPLGRQGLDPTRARHNRNRGHCGVAHHVTASGAFCVTRCALLTCCYPVWARRQSPNRPALPHIADAGLSRR